MYRKILLCYDGSKEGRAALKEGARLSRRLGAQAHLLAIIRPSLLVDGPDAVSEIALLAEERLVADLLADGVAKLRLYGVTASGRVAVGSPVAEIAAAAESLGADLIVVGHHTRGRLARWWAGAEEASLLDRIRCSILVCIGEAQPDGCDTCGQESG